MRGSQSALIELAIITIGSKTVLKAERAEWVEAISHRDKTFYTRNTTSEVKS